MSYYAKKDKCSNGGEAASGRLKKMSKIEEEEGGEIRKTEVENMTDPIALAHIAKTDNNYLIRAIAINNKNLADQSVFAHVAIHDPEVFLRLSAIRKITDTAMLNSLKDAY